ncbi:LysR family transcriptional regulator [Pseudomonas sp. LPB0260]|uniref:LysR family transcriptional regulator n=1 Tax=Pseudomonas sp. LPB0260 TaxID=2614442 RepID=UPI0015C2BBCC|nr:LysR family transcriptional regulator [Pseudomonas sp. LPB0260]QLC74788.1 LysR family transcriptional regulator [Pseudomonas sp. LPB0260]
MHISQIRTFLEVAETGSIIKSATHLHITQSTASSRIQQLEQELNQKLFIRSHSGVQLSPAGLRFQPYALRLLQTWQQAHQDMCLPDGFQGLFSLAIQATVWDRFSRPWITWMKSNVPDFALRVEADWSQRMIHNLSDGYLDIILTSVPHTVPGLKIEKLMDDPLILVSSCPASVSESLTNNYIYIDWGPHFNEQHSLAFSTISTPTLTVGLSDLALQIIGREGGSAYLPQKTVQAQIDQGTLYPVSDAPQLNAPLYLMYPEQHHNLEVLHMGLSGLRALAESMQGNPEPTSANKLTPIDG